MTVRAHPTALIEDGVTLGDGSSVWDNAHLRAGARVGNDCIVGGKAYLADQVVVGNRVKINTGVYLCSGVTVEDGVMLSAYVTFTNDRFPRATSPDLLELRHSGIDEHTEATLVREGATVGARAVIGPGLTIGRFAMIGMGSVVTKDVPDFHLCMGTPAVSVAVVCRCGPPVHRFTDGTTASVSCAVCGRCYDINDGRVTETHA